MTLGPWSNSQGTTSGNRYWHNPTAGTGPHFQLKSSHKDYEADACLKVMRDAFSDATTSPRIPDGKASESVGFRKKLIAEIEQDKNKPVEILFFAGLNSCLVMRNARFNASDASTDVTDYKYMRLDNHIMVQNATPGGTQPGPTEAYWDQEDSQQLCKWRPVSYGLLLSLVNSSDDNEGWWEAVRVNLCDNPTTFNAIIENVDANNRKPIQPLLITPNIPNLSSNQMLCNQSYSTGKLRNISQIVFQLNPEIKDYDFLRVNDKIRVTGSAGVSRGPAQHNDQPPLERVFTVPLGENPASPTAAGFASPGIQHDVLNGCVDSSYDAIFIRLHGITAGNRGSGDRGSVLTALAVMNQELIYGDVSRMATYQQSAPVSHKIKYLTHSNMQAATVYNMAQMRSWTPSKGSVNYTSRWSRGRYNGAYRRSYTKSRAPTRKASRRTTKRRTRTKTSSKRRSRR